jgi:hypothetical protein
VLLPPRRCHDSPRCPVFAAAHPVGAAKRARPQRTVAVEGAAHAMPVSRPDATLHPMLEAASLRVAA